MGAAAIQVYIPATLAMLQQLVTDGHAPSEYRADTVRNNDGWYAAFDIQTKDKLYLIPKDRVHIW